MFELNGKVAIVTGGNGGIGLGMARGLANAGARVVIAARNADKSRAAVEDLTGRGGEAHAVRQGDPGRLDLHAISRGALDRGSGREGQE